MVHGRGFCGTERGEGHGWYTGGDSEVRNGMEDTVGTREGLLRYGTGWRARLVHHNGYWCTKCTERRIYTQDEATPKPTQMRPACGGKGKGKGGKGKGGKGEGRKGEGGKGGKGEGRKGEGGKGGKGEGRKGEGGKGRKGEGRKGGKGEGGKGRKGEGRKGGKG